MSSRYLLFLLWFYLSLKEPTATACLPKTCGNLTISGPFWLTQEQAKGKPCGPVDYQVTCKNNSPILWSSQVFGLAILDIFYNNQSLLVVDFHKLQNFGINCRVPVVNTSSKLSQPFRMSSTNMDLLFYSCKSPVVTPWLECGLVPMNCSNNSYVFVGGRYNAYDNYEEYLVEGCSTTVMPVLGTSSKENASDYKKLISNGFLLTWTMEPDDRHNKKLAWIVSVSAAISLFLACLVWIMFRKKQKLSLFILQKPIGGESHAEYILQKYESLAPKRYRYSELKKITTAFKDKLGEGGYGMVFKGILEDGRMVAVKLLKGSKGNGEEFLNEVISIGRTSHVNVVSLLGFCLQGSKQALVYEYMVNGSLQEYIYSGNSKLSIGWEMLHGIAIGIARGLEYLHRGCSARIIHFDIKPQNILLDQDFCPKIADFGLAKLSHLKDSALSMADTRGTIGFIAPEVFSRGFGVVSTKSDVYSYGVMLLEMVRERNGFKENAGSSSEVYFPSMIYDHIEKEFQGYEVTSETGETVKKMTIVGLWCIQTNPITRPSMTRVIEMLERNNINELEMPPKPFLWCPSPTSYVSS